MKILYLGDIMGKPGRQIIAEHLSEIRNKYQPDLVIAQAENVSHGKSMTPMHMRALQEYGVDFFTGGNHTLERPGLQVLLDNPAEPVLAPANLHDSKPGWGTKIIPTDKGDIQITSLCGETVGAYPAQVDNPLHMIDKILTQTSGENVVARIVNFHGDYSSEKRVIGYYLDGRVSAVIGDHWHVPTADAMVLPHGTAHITDVGMCGTIHSSLGISKEVIINRWKNDEKIKFEINDQPPYQINAVLITIDEKTQLSTEIKSINLRYE